MIIDRIDSLCGQERSPFERLRGWGISAQDMMISPAEHNGNENKRVRSRDLTMEDLIRDYIEFP